jgi:hypothetical protein
VRAHLPQGPRLQAQAHLADGLLRLLGEVQVQVPHAIILKIFRRDRGA